MADETVAPQQLPLFEGQRPAGTAFRALSLAEEVILVVKATVAKVSHDLDNDGALTRLHVLSVDEAHELPGDQADMALVEGQLWSRKIAEALTGQQPLEGGS